MPAHLHKYPGYFGLSKLRPGYNYMPVWPMLLYPGQTLSRSTDIKSILFFVSFWSLDPTGGHSPDRLASVHLVYVHPWRIHLLRARVLADVWVGGQDAKSLCRHTPSSLVSWRPCMANLANFVRLFLSSAKFFPILVPQFYKVHFI
jgi:hypothetical protein